MTTSTHRPPPRAIRRPTLGIAAAILAIALAGIGCDSSPSADVSARDAQPKVVTKWKHEPKSAVGTPKGLIVESEGGQITTATLYEMKDGPGFDKGSRITVGHRFTKDGVLILLPIRAPVMSDDDWIANDGVRFEIAYDPKKTELMMQMKPDEIGVSGTTFKRFVESAEAPATPSTQKTAQ